MCYHHNQPSMYCCCCFISPIHNLCICFYCCMFTQCRISLQCVIIRISLQCVVVVVVAFYQYIICTFVFIVVCLHSAGLAFDVLSSGLAFNVLLLLLLQCVRTGSEVTGVIANSHPSDQPTDKVSYRAAFAAKNPNPDSVKNFNFQ